MRRWRRIEEGVLYGSEKSIDVIRAMLFRMLQRRLSSARIAVVPRYCPGFEPPARAPCDTAGGSNNLAATANNLHEMEPIFALRGVRSRTTRRSSVAAAVSTGTALRDITNFVNRL